MEHIPQKIRTLAREVDKASGGSRVVMALKGDLLSALYSLRRAHELGFSYETEDDEAYRSRLTAFADDLASKKEDDDIEQRCRAGYYFNSAILRMSAGFHISLKRLFHDVDANCYPLLQIAEKIGVLHPGEIDVLIAAHRDANEFKHNGDKLLKDRRVGTVSKAVKACEQLVALLKRQPMKRLSAQPSDGSDAATPSEDEGRETE